MPGPSRASTSLIGLLGPYAKALAAAGRPDDAVAAERRAATLGAGSNTPRL